MTLDSPNLPRSRRRKWLRVGAGALIFYTVFGFLILPAIIKWQIGKQVPPLTHRSVSVEKVRVNPYALSLLIGGLKLTETNGADFASLGEVYVNFEVSSLWHRAWVFKEIRVGSPYANVVLASNGMPNFWNLIPPPDMNAAPKTNGFVIPRVEIARLQITNGGVAFTDFGRSNVFTTRIAPIDLTLTNFATRPERDNPHEFTAFVGSGETVVWRGDFAVQPVRARGHLEVLKIPLRTYAPYLDSILRAQVDDGVVDFRVDYAASLAPGVTNATVTNLDVAVRSLRFVSAQSKEELAAVGGIHVRDFSADLATKSLRIGAVELQDGRGLARRYPAASKESTRVLDEAALEQMQETFVQLNTHLGWSLRVDSVQATNFAVRFEDMTLSPPAQLTITNLALVVRDISNASNAPTQAKVVLDFQPAGRVAVEIKAGLFPLQAEVEANVRDLDLRPFAPYARQIAPVNLTAGRLATTAKLFFHTNAASGPLVKARVDVTLDDFATSENLNATDLVKWKSLKVTGLTAELAPDIFHADEIAFVGLDTTVTVGKDGKLNLLELLAAPPSSNTPPPTVKATKPPPLPPVSLDTFRLTGASLRLQDRSLEPNALAEIHDLTGTVKGLTSSKDVRAAVDMAGRFDTAGPFRVAGEVQPLTPDWRDMFVKLAIGATNIDLGMASPYAGKFAGYPIQRGKVGSELSWHLEKRAIQANNSVIVNKLALGKKTGSTNATKLPVKLGIALLTDLDGNIELNVPVAGNLDDPKFQLGAVIWRVIENILLKAATAPFALLGSMFGGGSEELGMVDFAPGASDLDATATTRLEKLAEALAKRPLLTLEIAASVDRDSDRLALASAKLDAQLKSMRVRELTLVGKTAVALKDLKLDPADQDRLLLKVYTNTFGPLGASNSPANAPAKPASTRASDAPAKGAQALMAMQTKPQIITPSQDELERRLVENMTVTAGEFRELQQARAKQVLNFLLAKPGLTPERVYLTEDAAKTNAPPARRVIMTLN
ncbi:MAG: DUF748 domain-containing protein [Verrucomicrobia bacterium]|nr:DUF748 domain-containing protein [Verrucomicrobiota bacterium]